MNTRLMRAGAMVLVAGLTVPLWLAACAPTAPAVLAPAQAAAITAPAAPATEETAPALVGRPGQAVVDGKVVNPPRIKMGEPRVIARIIEEGSKRNQVMAHLTELSTLGPRLTGSSLGEQANELTKRKFESWGLQAELHQWGTIATRFDRGPSYGRVVTRSEKKLEDGTVNVSFAPGREFEFTTLAWTAGTSGPVRGKVVRMPETEEEYARVKDTLGGAWVLLKPLPTTGRGGVRGPGQRAGDRWQARKDARDAVAKGDKPASLPIDERVIFDGVAGFISTPKDSRDRVWTTAIKGWRDRPAGEIIPDVEVHVRLSDYDAINSRVSDGEDVFVEFDLQHTLTPGPIPVYNTIAMILGATKPEEYVIVCGHMDSWDGPGASGTIDNGTGVAVALEAARLLSVSGARPDRTIIFALWTGEEQGLLGSKEWVKAFPDKVRNISAVLNEDGGTNYQGGLKCMDTQVDMLVAATAPVNFVFTDSTTGKPMVVNVQNSGKEFPKFAGSDHFSFIEVGIPGFFWDEVGRADYGLGWHTQFDRLNLAIPEYLVQSSVNAAVTAYNLACAPTLLPRWDTSKPIKDSELLPASRFGVQNR